MCTGTWPHWVYGAPDHAYFSRGPTAPYLHRLQLILSGTTGWWRPLAIGQPNTNWTHEAVGVDASEKELCRFNRFGEFGFVTQGAGRLLAALP